MTHISEPKSASENRWQRNPTQIEWFEKSSATHADELVSTIDDSNFSRTLNQDAGIVEAKKKNADQATRIHSDERKRRVAAGVCWGIAGWLIFVHVGALAAPFTFTWQALVLTIALHWLTGGIGICLGYHRLLTHSSFCTYTPVRWILALLGGLAGEGSAIEWVANHRKHHAHSDSEGDPHTPLDGSWWSHVFWIAWTSPPTSHKKHIQRWAPDIANDRGMVYLNWLFIPLHFLSGGLLFAIGHWIGGMSLALSFLVWGMFLRLVFVMHSTWFVNSASHIWGYQNYATKDNSRNLWWVALLAYGEGWHNNHHAYPRMAKHGHRWWEIDTTFWVIRLMQRLGLAWNVVDYKQRSHTD